jgi:hypothetical protein
MTRTDRLILHGHAHHTLIMHEHILIMHGHARSIRHGSGSVRHAGPVRQCEARGVGGAGARGPGRTQEARAVDRRSVCFDVHHSITIYIYI